jgi:hypothetical protein
MHSIFGSECSIFFDFDPDPDLDLDLDDSSHRFQRAAFPARNGVSLQFSSKKTK